MGFFNLTEKLRKYEIPYTQKALVCFNGPRNIGKTTCVLNDIFFGEEFGVSPDKKVGFIRNSKEQMETFRGDFNERMNGKFKIIGKMVYSLKKTVMTNKEGEEIVAYVKDQHVGYLGSINTYTTLKSVEAKCMRYLIYDEYCEDRQYNQYPKFVNLLKTLERLTPKFLLIMIGNRDTPNNDYMVAWNIFPPEDYTYDTVIKFSKRGYFIELGDEQFSDLGNDDTLANELAVFNEDTSRYLLENGYMIEANMQVVPYDLAIKPTIEPMFRVGLNGRLLVLCEFNHHKTGKKVCGLVSNRHALELAKTENLAAFALDGFSYQMEETYLNNTETIKNIVKKLLLAHKFKNLYYDSFDILEDFVKTMLIVDFDD